MARVQLETEESEAPPRARGGCGARHNANRLSNTQQLFTHSLHLMHIYNTSNPAMQDQAKLR